MKKIFIFAIAMLAIACMLAFTVSAAELDKARESVTLSDGTVCYLWDAEGDALIWYISTANPDDGYTNYDYVKATSDKVKYNCGWNGETFDGVFQYQLGETFEITGIDGKTYGTSTMVVVNLMDDVKITTGKNIGKQINAFSKTFNGKTKLEYVYLPLGTVAINAETFKNCSNLKYCNVANLTELRRLNTQAFSACSSLLANQHIDLSNTKLVEACQGCFSGGRMASITFPSTLKHVGEWAFQNCTKLKSISFSGTLTSVDTKKLFYGCTSLESITGFSAFKTGLITTLGTEMFYDNQVLTNVEGLMKDGVIVIPEGVTKIDQSAFYKCKAIKYLSLPSTITTIDSQAFFECTSLQLVDFNNNPNNIYFGQYANGHFRGCTALKAVCLPDNITTIYNGLFADCTNLEVVYLPSALTLIDGNKYGDGAFDDCKNLYFTSEKFDVKNFTTNGVFDAEKFNQNKPVKKDIYCFPSNLVTMGDTQNSPTFIYCTNINPILVFPTTFTGFLSGDGDLLNIGTKDSPKKVIFMGDISEFKANTGNSRQNYVSYYFMDQNDKVPTDTGYKNGNSADATEGYMYFCADNGYYRIKGNSSYSEKITGSTHVINTDATKINEAGCETKGSIITYCFCNKDSSTDIDPLGHNFENGKQSAEFGDTLYSEAWLYTCCIRNCGTTDAKQKAVIVDLGYSISEYKSATAIARTFMVDKDLLALYEAEYGAVSIGFGASKADDFTVGDDGITSDDFKIDMVVKSEEVEDIYSTVCFKIAYKDDTYKDTLVYVAGYYVDAKGTFFADSELEAQSYNSIKAMNIE